MLQGYLTYIGGCVVIAGAFVGIFTGKFTYEQFGIVLGAGIAIIGGRRAIAKITNGGK